MRKTYIDRSPSGKILACLLVAACTVIGVVGLVLPIIPGLLFLAIAAVIVTRRVPWLDARLRRHHALGKHFDRADAFAELGFVQKLQVLGLYCVKMVADTLAFVTSMLGRSSRAPR